MMPTSKHKRKASARTKTKLAKPPGLVALHPKLSIFFSILLIVISMYLLAFQASDNAMFGLAMLSLIAGVGLTIAAKMAITKKNKT